MIYIFIARQHAMHAERNIVLAIPSVRRPSSAGTVSKRMYIIHNTFLLKSGSDIGASFLNPSAVTKFQGKHPVWC